MSHKLSKYVYFIDCGNCIVMYNLRSRDFLSLNTDLGKLLDSARDNIDMLRKKHPDLFRLMEEKEFIVDADTDEIKQLVDEWEQEDSDTRKFSIIVNPTLGCNLRCWYCYENHEHKPLMNESVYNSILRLIDNKLQSEKFESLNISFFGGEPLLGFDKIVMPILTYACQKCKNKGKSITTHFTTNGVLLTKDVLDAINNLELSSKAMFQITLDGNREIHNQSRVGINKAPTYDTVLANIIRAAESQNMVCVRLNYKAENLMSFLDVLDDFADLPDETKRYIRFNLQQIWQDCNCNTVDISNLVKNVKNNFRKEKFFIDSNDGNCRHCCYADMENSVVVNYDGNVYKCTAREFLPENREGVLYEDGTIEMNNLYEKRMAVKYSNPSCLECKILPICNGGCSQHKLEANSQTWCYYNISEEEKDKRVISSLKELVAMSESNKKL